MKSTIKAFVMLVVMIVALATSIYFTATEELEVVGANYSLYVERDGKESTTTSKLRTGDVVERCEDGMCRVIRTYSRYFYYPAQRDSANSTVCSYVDNQGKLSSKEYPGNAHNCMGGRHLLDGFVVFLIIFAHFVALAAMGVMLVPAEEKI